jgi:chemotaxis protein CheX
VIVSEANVLVLPAVLDLRAAAALKTDIEQRAGAALDIDASKVERLGGICLQILASASAAWRASGHEVRLTGASEAFLDHVRLMNAGHLLSQQGIGSEVQC